MTSVLITGGSSYLGQYLVPLALAGRGPEAVVYTTYSHDPLGLPQGRRLDVRDGAAVRALVQETRPGTIIHLAGSNRPAGTMDAVIRQGARHVTAAAQEIGARLIHMSTDVVFDGRDAPYHEDDPPTPLHAYGRAKAAAEEIVARHEDHVIVRTSLIYSLDLMDRGTEWMVEALQASRPVTLFTNQMRSPVYAPALSRALLELAEMAFTGILHVAGPQCLSRADFGLKMLDWWGIEQRHTLSFGPCDPEKWPLNCCLDIGRAQALLQTSLPAVDDVLNVEV